MIELTINDQHVREIITLFREAKKFERQAKREVERTQKAVKEYIDGLSEEIKADKKIFLYSGNDILIVTKFEKTMLDTKLLSVLFPDAYYDCSYQQEQTRMTFDI